MRAFLLLFRIHAREEYVYASLIWLYCYLLRPFIPLYQFDFLSPPYVCESRHIYQRAEETIKKGLNEKDTHTPNEWTNKKKELRRIEYTNSETVVVVVVDTHSYRGPWPCAA